MTLREWLEQAVRTVGRRPASLEMYSQHAQLLAVLHGLEARHAPCLEAPVDPDGRPGTAHGVLCALAHSFVAVATTQLDEATFAVLYQEAQRRIQEEV